MTTKEYYRSAMTAQAALARIPWDPVASPHVPPSPDRGPIVALSGQGCEDPFDSEDRRIVGWENMDKHRNTPEAALSLCRAAPAYRVTTDHRIDFLRCDLRDEDSRLVIQDARLRRPRPSLIGGRTAESLSHPLTDAQRAPGTVPS